MGLPNYDTWKLSPPPETEVVGKCSSCGVDLHEGDEVFYDGEYMEYFCDKQCYKDHVVKFIDDYVDIVIENLDVRRTIIEKETA